MHDYYDQIRRDKERLELENAERELLQRRKQIESREVASVFMEGLFKIYQDHRLDSDDSRPAYNAIKELRGGLPSGVRVKMSFDGNEEATLIFTFRDEEIERIYGVELSIGGEIVLWLIHNRYMSY